MRSDARGDMFDCMGANRISTAVIGLVGLSFVVACSSSKKPQQVEAKEPGNVTLAQPPEQNPRTDGAPPPGTACLSNAECVVSTFSGCCQCCNCTIHPYAVHRDDLARHKRDCSRRRCDLRMCATVDCAPCEPPPADLLAECIKKHCQLAQGPNCGATFNLRARGKLLIL